MVELQSVLQRCVSHRACGILTVLNNVVHSSLELFLWQECKSMKVFEFLDGLGARKEV